MQPHYAFLLEIILIVSFSDFLSPVPPAHRDVDVGGTPGVRRRTRPRDVDAKSRLRIYRELDTSVVDAWFDPAGSTAHTTTIHAHVEALDTAKSTRSPTPLVDASLTASSRRSESELECRPSFGNGVAFGTISVVKRYCSTV